MCRGPDPLEGSTLTICSRSLTCDRGKGLVSRWDRPVTAGKTLPWYRQERAFEPRRSPREAADLDHCNRNRRAPRAAPGSDRRAPPAARPPSVRPASRSRTPRGTGPRAIRCSRAEAARRPTADGPTGVRACSDPARASASRRGAPPCKDGNSAIWMSAIPLGLRARFTSRVASLTSSRCSHTADDTTTSKLSSAKESCWAAMCLTSMRSNGSLPPES